MKKKIYVFVALMSASVSVLAFTHAPDTWTYCMDDSATYVNGGESAPVSGYCNIVDERVMENNLVFISSCESTGGMWDAPTCTGNGALHADVTPE